MTTNEKKEIKTLKIESDGELTKVYTPNGDLIPCIGIEFIHKGGELPKVILEVLDFELDARVSEDALEFIRKNFEQGEEEQNV